MDRRRLRQSKIVIIARLGLAVVLLIGFLSNIAPLAPVSAGSLCRLECCAGRAPHAAGSCMNGSCHAVLSTHKTATARRITQVQGDEFCGLDRMVATKVIARTRVEHSPQPAESGPATVSAAAFVRPCQPDSGGCASGFANSNRQRNSAAIADVDRPRGPTVIRLSSPGYDRSRILEALCRQCAPRGPPVSFS
jgi:hypothetical protein